MKQRAQVGLRAVALQWALLPCLLVLMASGSCRGDKPPVVCIDPGHPSETSDGCRGPSGVREMTVVWEVGEMLGEALRGQGLRVVMTKSSEKEHVTNRDRATIANEADAALMVRLHCDAGGGSGAAVYYPDRQGRVQGVTGPPESVRDASRQAAVAMTEAMKSVLAGKLKVHSIRGDSATAVGSRQGALTGSIFSKCPVICVEMVMLTDASDERFIQSEAGRELMVLALTEGVCRFLQWEGPRAQKSDPAGSGEEPGGTVADRPSQGGPGSEGDGPGTQTAALPGSGATTGDGPGGAPADGPLPPAQQPADARQEIGQDDTPPDTVEPGGVPESKAPWGLWRHGLVGLLAVAAGALAYAGVALLQKGR